MKKYYINTSPTLFSNIFQEIEAEPLDIFPDLDLFIHKNNDNYVISEATSGYYLSEKSTLQECIDNVHTLDIQNIVECVNKVKRKSPYNYVTDEIEKNTFKIGMEVYTKNRTGHGEILGFTKDNKVYVRMNTGVGMLDTFLPFDVLSKHCIVSYHLSENQLDEMFGVD